MPIMMTNWCRHLPITVVAICSAYARWPRIVSNRVATYSKRSLPPMPKPRGANSGSRWLTKRTNLMDRERLLWNVQNMFLNGLYLIIGECAVLHVWMIINPKCSCIRSNAR